MLLGLRQLLQSLKFDTLVEGGADGILDLRDGFGAGDGLVDRALADPGRLGRVGSEAALMLRPLPAAILTEIIIVAGSLRASNGSLCLRLEQLLALLEILRLLRRRE